MEVKVLKLSFNNIEIARRDIPKIRGYIAGTYPEFDELHNHNGDGYLYRYPLIQYKLIDDIPYIIGINEGGEILHNIEESLEKININKQDIDIFEKGISFTKCKYGISNELIRYKFISPWMCLNEKNHQIYIVSDEAGKIDILKRVLIGNILSMSKRFKYNIEDKLIAYVSLSPCKISFKNKEMIGFKGEFIVNFYIPDYMGIGKSVSRGFGTVKCVGGNGFK